MKVTIKHWKVIAEVDSDNHLNIYVENEESNEILEIESGQGDGINEQMALRFTTPKIESDYIGID